MDVAFSDYFSELLCFLPACSGGKGKSRRDSLVLNNNTSAKIRAHSDNSELKMISESVLQVVQEEHPSTGVRRDRTAHFMQMRKPRRSRVSLPSTQLNRIFREYLHITVALCQALAQLEGILRFGPDIAARVPSLEMRMCATDARTRIEELLNALGRTLQDLKDPEIVCVSIAARDALTSGVSEVIFVSVAVREALIRKIEVVLEQKRAAFIEQIEIADALRVQAPLTSPSLSSDLNARLSAAILLKSSPSVSSRATTSSCSPLSPFRLSDFPSAGSSPDSQHVFYSSSLSSRLPTLFDNADALMKVPRGSRHANSKEDHGCFAIGRHGNESRN